MNLSSLNVRSNSGTVTANWWNDIRLVLLGLFGTGVTANAQMNLANNTTAVVTNCIFSSATYARVRIEYCLIRSGVRQSGYITLLYTSGAWELAEETEGDANVDFTVNATTGQVSYTTDNGATGKLQWKVISTFGVES